MSNRYYATVIMDYVYKVTIKWILLFKSNLLFYFEKENFLQKLIWASAHLSFKVDFHLYILERERKKKNKF